MKDSYGNQRFYGIYRGAVYDNNDPINKYRLKIIVPQVLGTQPTSWTWVSVQAGAPSSTPQIGTGVLVMFEGGDPNYPICVGYFGEKATPWVIDCGEI